MDTPLLPPQPLPRTHPIPPDQLWVQLTPQQQHHVQQRVISLCRAWITHPLSPPEAAQHER